MTGRSQTHIFFYMLMLLPALAAQAQPGLEWKRVESPAGANYSRIQFVYFFNKNDGVVAGDAGLIRYTRNGGVPWQQSAIFSRNNTPLPIRDDFYRGMRAEDTLFLMGVRYLLYSRDKGKNWHEAGSPQTVEKLGIAWGRQFYYADVFFINEDEGWLLCVVLNDLKGSGKFMNFVMHTSNRGLDWEAYPMLPTDRKLRKMFFVNNKLGWAVGEGGVILHCEDGGRVWEKQNWKPRTRPARGKGRLPVGTHDLLDVVFADKKEGIVVGTKGTILRTTDGGEWWEPIDPPLLQSGAKDNYDLVKVQFVEDHDEDSYWWIVGHGGDILCSGDDGDHWGRQPALVSNALYSIHMLNRNSGWAGGDGRTLLRYREDEHRGCGFDDGRR